MVPRELARLPAVVKVLEESPERFAVSLLRISQVPVGRRGLGIALIAVAAFAAMMGLVLWTPMAIGTVYIFGLSIVLLGHALTRTAPAEVGQTDLSIDSSRLRLRGDVRPCGGPLDLELSALVRVIIYVHPVRRRPDRGLLSWLLWKGSLRYSVAIVVQAHARFTIPIIEGLRSIQSAFYLWQQIESRCAPSRRFGAPNLAPGAELCYANDLLPDRA